MKLLNLIQGSRELFKRKTLYLTCVEVDYNDKVLWKLIYFYFVLKVFDLLDTIFIILRKRKRQLSVLHCFHHFTMIYGSYIVVMWHAYGQVIPVGLLNSFIHTIMYFYYFLCAFEPELKSSILWKKRITQLQIVSKILFKKNSIKIFLPVSISFCFYSCFFVFV